MIKLGTTLTKTCNIFTQNNEPLEDFETFKKNRIKKNVDADLSECCYQRRTGRTTKMIISAAEYLVNHPDHSVAIVSHSFSMLNSIERTLNHYVNQYCIAPLANRIFFVTNEIDLAGRHVNMKFFDNVFDDVKDRLNKVQSQKEINENR